MRGLITCESVSVWTPTRTGTAYRLIIGDHVNDISSRSLGDRSARDDDGADGALLGDGYRDQHAAAQRVAGIVSVRCARSTKAFQKSGPH